MKTPPKLTSLITCDALLSIRNLDFTELADRSLLLTGASGLIGIHFLASLAAAVEKFRIQPRVHVVVHSEPEPLLVFLAGKLDAKIWRGDLSSRSFCASLPACDYVIHMGGYAQPARFTADPVRTLKINVMATLSMIEKLSPGGKFLFGSSAEVYTGLQTPPFNENQIGSTNTTHPRFSYIEGKRAGEAICNAFRSNGVQAKSARIGHTYGPGTKRGDTRVLNSLIEKGLQGKIELLDRGEALRTFVYVTDAVNMMWNILFHGTQSIYNVGGRSRVSILELAKMIGHLTRAPVRLPQDSAGALAGSPTNVELDMARYEQEFGTRQFEDLHSGLSRTVAWQSEQWPSLHCQTSSEQVTINDTLS